jgi:hypothetical protein
MPSKLSRAGSVAGPGKDAPGQLDARTVAEMARRRREKFGTSAAIQKRSGDKSAAVVKLRSQPSGCLPQQQKGQTFRMPRLDPAGPNLAELVESDLFPDTPRRCTSSKTVTPAATPTLASDGKGLKLQPLQQQEQPPPPQADAQAGANAELGASPVRTPSPMAGSPRSMQRSDTQDADLGASDISTRLKALTSLVNAEEGEDGSALQGELALLHFSLLLLAPSAL